MPNLQPYIMFALGLVMIIKGSDWFIDAVIWIARVLKIPDLIIGATLVSICTTLPETTVSAGAALIGNTEIALGNALGSIACNTGLILAIIIFFSRPRLRDRGKLQKNGVLLMILLILIFMIGYVFGAISRVAGCFLMGVLALYLYHNVRESLASRKNEYDLKAKHGQKVSRTTTVKNLIIFVIGLALIIWGSNLLVTNGEIIARLVGVPDIVIGLTITAFGTSLPELMTAITAIRKQVHDISIGNILGANILNVIWVIDLAHHPADSCKPGNLRFHFPFVFAIVSTTVAFIYINKRYFQRSNGLLLLAIYAVYLFLTVR